MKKLSIKNILEKKLEYGENQFLIEGIDIDNLNPTYSTILNDIPIISIFKRKKTEQNSQDGNPLIYALKGIKGWSFENPKQDITNLLKKFIRITEKIQPKYDTIITVPSINSLNNDFLYRLNKIIKSDFNITDYFHKLTSEEVFEDFIDWNQISIDHKDKFKEIEKKLNSFFYKMNEENNGYFSYKFIKDLNLRKYIKKSSYSEIEKTIEYADRINDKNILILDDTIASGSTISGVCQDIINEFTPKSITVITLFSKI